MLAKDIVLNITPEPMGANRIKARTKHSLWATLIFITLYFSINTSVHSQASLYQPKSEVNGTLSIVGSDTMAELIQAWADNLSQHNPKLSIQLHAAGSGTAPPALTRGTANLGAMSRPMNNSEHQDFIRTYGYPATELTVALDAIAIVVNQNNPIDSLSLAQISSMFSANNQCHQAIQPIQNWSALLVGSPEHALYARSLQRFGRNAASGTYIWFRDNVLCGKDYRPTVNGLAGNGAIITAVQQALNGIGYVGIAFVTAGVKPLAITIDSAPPVTPTIDTMRSGEYPLSRQLYLYANRPPGRRFTPQVKEFLKMVYSPTGQATVTRVGLIALPEDTIAEVIETQQLNAD